MSNSGALLFLGYIFTSFSNSFRSNGLLKVESRLNSSSLSHVRFELALCSMRACISGVGVGGGSILLNSEDQCFNTSALSAMTSPLLLIVSHGMSFFASGSENFYLIPECRGI